MKRLYILLLLIAAGEAQSQDRLRSYVSNGMHHYTRYELQLALTAGAVLNKIPAEYGEFHPQILEFAHAGVDTASTDSLSAGKDSAAILVLKEAGFGSLMGMLLGGAGGLLGHGLSGGNVYAAVFGACVGYTVGSSLGIYIVAKGQKPNLSFLGTLASGIVGAGIGFNLISRLNSLAPLLIIPVVASIIYVELID